MPIVLPSLSLWETRKRRVREFGAYVWKVFKRSLSDTLHTASRNNLAMGGLIVVLTFLVAWGLGGTEATTRQALRPAIYSLIAIGVLVGLVWLVNFLLAPFRINSEQAWNMQVLEQQRDNAQSKVNELLQRAASAPVAHQISVLSSELATLHSLFLEARAATDDERLTDVESLYRLQVEHSIVQELATDGKLLAHFWDDTESPQAKSTERKEEMTTFLQRRHQRLKEIIEQLQERL